MFMPAIYAARELSTAWAEYNQGFVQHPALIVQLELRGARLADLTDASVLLELGVDEAIHRCEWRDALDKGAVPETHRLQSELLARDYHGVIYPSFMSLEFYFFAGFLYFVINYGIERFGRYVERKTAVPS